MLFCFVVLKLNLVQRHGYITELELFYSIRQNSILFAHGFGQQLTIIEIIVLKNATYPSAYCTLLSKINYFKDKQQLLKMSYHKQSCALFYIHIYKL